MSASLVPSQSTNEWLPLPRDADDSESFSKDLIQQFDKKRSRLRVEMGELEKQNGAAYPGRNTPVSSSVSDLRTSSGAPPPVPTPQQQEEKTRTTAAEDNVAYAQGRRRSAGDLLRRSSAYFKAKLDVFRGSRSHDNLRDSQSAHLPSTSNALRSISSKKKQPSRTTRAEDIFNASSASLPPPSKIAINTTISIPQFAIPVQHPPPAHFAGIKPPVITQYPPKPLKYSPVEPASDDFMEKQNRTIVHRISLPVLRRGGHDHEHRSATARRRSDTDMREPAGRKSKLSKKKQKGKEPATESPTA
ncbi:hypothetical protein DFQ28_007325 [Apophysomyces sp. BC1034]|nr:hypothetical protein DFQ30_007180 [Apophysomyces sp. BC1015]KAG0176355.1 hypothetical protein DFQ29_006231 [Apophysomyces sp. BC1021]KAG0186771.1 hypothetical protein DFQ28_007325 [Apophysomyces sp. BC1034]